MIMGKRKLSSLLLAAVLILGLFAPINAAYAEESKPVTILAQEEGSQGNGWEEEVTRGEFIEALIKTLDVSVPEIVVTEDYRYTDVVATLAPYVEAAHLLEITNGISVDVFGANEKVTREQAYVFLIRALNLADDYTVDKLAIFKDADRISTWAETSIAAAVELGLAEANTDGVFRPEDVLKRNEMAEILYTYMRDIDKITIIHTNDIHGRIAYDKNNGEMGFGKIATIVEKTEAKNSNTLVLDMGDTFHGTNYVTFNEGKAAIEVMNAIGYQAMVPGNHDFNYGQATLLALAEEAAFPIISGNILTEAGEGFLNPYVIVESMGKRIALVGVTATDTVVKTHPNNVEGLTFADEVAISNKYATELAAEVDHIILMSHAGNDTDESIAAQVAGIDLILGGHSHSTYEKPIRIGSTYVTQAFEYGKAVGITNILYYKDKFIGINGYLARDNSQLEPKAEIEAIIDKYRVEVEEALQEEISEVSVALEGAREKVRIMETNLGNLIADAMRHKVDADIAFQNGGGIRASIDVGMVTLEEVVTVLPFTNTVVKMELTGEQIRKSLEYSVRLYPEQNGGFLHISGMSFSFDPTKAVGERVVEVLVGGEALVEDKIYTVATNDFVAVGGDGYEWLKDGKILANTGELLSTALIEYLRSGVDIPSAEGRIVAVE